MARRIRSRTPVATSLALLCAVALTACGSFDSSASGNGLIKDYVKKFGQGRVRLTSVSCPGGVSFKVGQAFDCKVTLAQPSTGKTSSGTITVHMVSGNKVEIFGSQDVHVP